MSAWLADFIFRFRYPLCALHPRSASSRSRRCSTSPRSTTTSACGSRRTIPSTRPTSASARSSADSGRCSIALKSDRLFTPESARRSSATSPATSSGSTRSSASRAWPRRTSSAACLRLPTTRAASRSSRCSTTISSGPAAADRVRRRALDDDLLRGDLVSEDGTVTAILVSFDEDRIDAVRGRRHRSASTSSSTRACPPGMTALLQRQPRDQRDLQPHHAREHAEADAADPAADGRRHLHAVPLVAHHRRPGRGRARQRRLDDGPVRADGVHLQHPRQHAAAAGHHPGGRRRRAHRPALQPRAARDREQGARVQVEHRSICSCRCSAPAARRRSGCCRWPPATSSPCARSGSAPRSA